MVIAPSALRTEQSSCRALKKGRSTGRIGTNHGLGWTTPLVTPPHVFHCTLRSSYKIMSFQKHGPLKISVHHSVQYRQIWICRKLRQPFDAQVSYENHSMLTWNWPFQWMTFSRCRTRHPAVWTPIRSKCRNVRHVLQVRSSIGSICWHWEAWYQGCYGRPCRCHCPDCTE